jgi:hypothetical protein
MLLQMAVHCSKNTHPEGNMCNLNRTTLNIILFNLLLLLLLLLLFYLFAVQIMHVHGCHILYNTYSRETEHEHFVNLSQCSQSELKFMEEHSKFDSFWRETLDG